MLYVPYPCIKEYYICVTMLQADFLHSSWKYFLCSNSVSIYSFLIFVFKEIKKKKKNLLQGNGMSLVFQHLEV